MIEAFINFVGSNSTDQIEANYELTNTKFRVSIMKNLQFTYQRKELNTALLSILDYFS